MTDHDATDTVTLKLSLLFEAMTPNDATYDPGCMIVWKQGGKLHRTHHKVRQEMCNDALAWLAENEISYKLSQRHITFTGPNARTHAAMFKLKFL